MPLTFLQVKNAKPGPARKALADGRGLRLIVNPKGTKTWKFNYQIGGRRKEVSGGNWPDVSLDDARAWREEMRKMVAAGKDPARLAREAKMHELGDTFEEVGREWFEKAKGKWKAKHADWVMRRLELDAFAVLGAIPIAQVTHRDVHRLISRIEDRGALEMAEKTIQKVDAIFRYARATQRATDNPVPDVRGAMKAKPKAKNHTRLPVSRLPEFYSKLDRCQADPVTKLALEWTILTMVRTAETRFARPAEIEGRDGDSPIWRVPAERMKMGREHIVPLPRQAIPLLDQIETLAAKEGSPWLFPQTLNPKKPISENRMLYCLYDLGFKGVATVHGFRGVASTVLNEQTNADGSRRFDSDWIELQLAHAEEDAVRGAYNAAEYIGPRRAMVQWWADWLDEHKGLGALL